MVSVTDHGCRRIRSRCGLSKKSAARMAEDAFENGITHANTTGSLNRYITALYFHNMSANNIRILNDKVFVFAGRTLITVLNLPPHYRKIVNKLAKKLMIQKGDVSESI